MSFRNNVLERLSYLPDWIKSYLYTEERFSLSSLIKNIEKTYLTLHSEFERIRQENQGYNMVKRYEINYSKCQSHHQQILYSILQLFWPAIIRTEKWFHDKTNKERYRGDIYIKVNDFKLDIELNGRHHLLKGDRNIRDQNKSKFLTEESIMVITWTNEWMETHWWDIPMYILKIIEDKMSDNKEFIYKLIKSDNFQELFNIRDFILCWIKE